MKKYLFAVIAAVMVMTLCGCANTFQGTVSDYKWHEHTVYVFDSLDDLKASLKYIIKTEYGQIPLNNGMEKKFDEAIKTITFKKENNENYSTLYPDFSQINGNIMAFATTSFHRTGGNAYVSTGYRTGCVEFFVYDPDIDTISEAIDIDSGCSVD